MHVKPDPPPAAKASAIAPRRRSAPKRPSAGSGDIELNDMDPEVRYSAEYGGATQEFSRESPLAGDRDVQQKGARARGAPEHKPNANAQPERDVEAGSRV